ncbi:hypothetical protein EBR66_00555 [bacterium]|nr:hypothetical protein [bacterium]
MKTAVLIHGHHLGTSNWEEVVWGDPKSGVYGRAPAGVREAIRFNADILFFPTGGSEKQGLKEGQWAFNITQERFRDIPECNLWTEDEAHDWLTKRAVLELTSTTTVTEIGTCMKIAQERGMERIVLVSGPTHLPRALLTALTLCASDPHAYPYAHGLCAIPSDTCYAGTTAEDVVIVEPPHRPDRNSYPLHQLVKELLAQSNGEQATDILAKIQGLLNKTQI